MAEPPRFRKPDRYKASGYRAYDGKMPERYDASAYIRLCQVPLWHRTVVGELERDDRSAAVLDVGCGTGTLLARLAAAGFASLAGVDLAPGMLDVAREKLAAAGARADLRAADAEDVLPWPPGSFDVVTMTGALHHFYRPLDLLAEVRRVLRPGGRLVVVDPCFFAPMRQVFNLALRVFPHAGDYRFYAPEKARRLLATGGFDCAEPMRIGLWAYLLRATRP